MFGLNELGFAGTLQFVLMVIFLLIGVGLLFFQSKAGTAFVIVMLSALITTAFVVGYSAYSFSMATAETAIGYADPAQRERLGQLAREQSMAYFKIAGLNAGILAAFVLVAAARRKRL